MLGPYLMSLEIVGINPARGTIGPDSVGVSTRIRVTLNGR